MVRAQHKVADYEALTVDPDLVAEVDRIVDAVNAKRSRVEHVRKFRILPHELTIAAGELTPTLKVKRNMVNDALPEPHRRDVRDRLTTSEPW